MARWTLQSTLKRLCAYLYRGGLKRLLAWLTFTKTLISTLRRTL